MYVSMGKIMYTHIHYVMYDGNSLCVYSQRYIYIYTTSESNFITFFMFISIYIYIYIYIHLQYICFSFSVYLLKNGAEHQNLCSRKKHAAETANDGKTKKIPYPVQKVFAGIASK